MEIPIHSFATLIEQAILMLSQVSLFILYTCQGRSQNLEQVPQKFTEVFNIDYVTAKDVIKRNQHRKEKNKLEFHSNHCC